MSATIKRNAKAKAITEQRAQEAMQEYAALKSSIDTLAAKQEADMLKVKTKYADDLQRYKEQMEAAAEVLRTYAEENPQLFADKKTRPLGLGQIGYRQGPEKLILLEGWSWEKVTEWVDDDFKRVKEEIDKAALLKAAKTDLEWAAEVGLTIGREESFFIKV